MIVVDSVFDDRDQEDLRELETRPPHDEPPYRLLVPSYAMMFGGGFLDE